MNGDDLKQEGIQQVLATEPEEWKAAYDYAADAYLIGMPENFVFRAETMHDKIRGKTGEPHHPNCWSAKFSGFVKRHIEAGRIIEAGAMKSVRASRHSNLTRVYKKVQHG